MSRSLESHHKSKILNESDLNINQSNQDEDERLDLEELHLDDEITFGNHGNEILNSEHCEKLTCSVNFTPSISNIKKEPFLIDVFRALHPRQRDAFTVWNTKERARETNYGTRIDYILTTRDLFDGKSIHTCENVKVTNTSRDLFNSNALNVTQDLSSDGVTNRQDISEREVLNSTTKDVVNSGAVSRDPCSTRAESATRYLNSGGAITQGLFNARTVKTLSDSPRFQKCTVRSDVYGSDHCPVECVLDVEFIRSSSVPSSCALFMPELSGKQQKIKSYFTQQQSSKRPLTTDDAGDGNCGDARSSKKVKKTCFSTTKKQDISSYFGSKNSLSSSCSSGDKKALNITDTTISDADVAAKMRMKSNRNFDLLDLHFKQIEKMAQEKRQTNNSTKNFKKNTDSNTKNTTNSTATWKGLFKGPEAAPLCSGHNEKCILQTVKKDGPNIGRQFYCCARPSGHLSNKEARCKFFKWKTSK